VSDSPAITFLGRGQAYRDRDRLILTVCPLCSQRNAPAAAPTGRCGWCAYEPDARDADVTGEAEAPLAVG
jgi:hypothetical protein